MASQKIVTISDRLAVLGLSWGFQGNSKPFQNDRSLASSGYEHESKTTILFKVSFWYVVARTELLGGETVVVTLHFMSVSGVPRNFVLGGVQQIQLRTEDRENRDLGAAAP